jgi:hypothetical protein
MIQKSFWTILFLLLSSSAYGFKCPNHTPDQSYLVSKAYYTGLPHDMGYTLAAIVVQESFVGRHIVRVNNKDGKYGSYGITHILLSTAMWLEGYTNAWEAKAELVPKLVGNDEYALELALKKLQSVNHDTWLEKWASFNGSGLQSRKYAGKISKHIKMLKRCYGFEKDF